MIQWKFCRIAADFLISISGPLFMALAELDIINEGREGKRKVCNGGFKLMELLCIRPVLGHKLK